MEQNLKIIASTVILTFMSLQTICGVEDTKETNSSTSSLLLGKRSLHEDTIPKVEFFHLSGDIMHNIFLQASKDKYFMDKVLTASYKASFDLICTGWRLVCKDWQNMIKRVDDKTGFLRNVLISAYEPLNNSYIFGLARSKDEVIKAENYGGIRVSGSVNLGEMCKYFSNGKLVYTPEDGSEVIELRVSDLKQPFSDKFNLSKCGDAAQYVRIGTGFCMYDTFGDYNDEAESIYISPRFVNEREFHFSSIRYHLRILLESVSYNHDSNDVDRISDTANSLYTILQYWGAYLPMGITWAEQCDDWQNDVEYVAGAWVDGLRADLKIDSDKRMTKEEQKIMLKQFLNKHDMSKQSLYDLWIQSRYIVPEMDESTHPHALTRREWMPRRTHEENDQLLQCTKNFKFVFSTQPS